MKSNYQKVPATTHKRLSQGVKDDFAGHSSTRQSQLISARRNNFTSSHKTEADCLKKLEIWWLLRDMKNRARKTSTISFGTDGAHGSVGCQIFLWTPKPYVRFYYFQTHVTTGEKKKFDYEIPLTKTPCPFGGYRYWFVCPMTRDGANCGRRVGVLYLDDAYFACRHCHDLTYSSRIRNRRGTSGAMVGFLESDMRARELQQHIKRVLYAGKPTKKQQRLWQLEAQMGAHGRNFTH